MSGFYVTIIAISAILQHRESENFSCLVSVACVRVYRANVLHYSSISFSVACAPAKNSSPSNSWSSLEPRLLKFGARSYKRAVFLLIIGKVLAITITKSTTTLFCWTEIPIWQVNKLLSGICCSAVARQMEHWIFIHFIEDSEFPRLSLQKTH